MEDERRSNRDRGGADLPPVLLIHGTFSRAALMAPWARYLESHGFECQTPSLPGRDPTDRSALRRLGMSDYLDALLELRGQLSVPPIVIGHSMGGLLAQQLAAATPCTALVCLASVPPGVLWAQPRALPHLVRLLPRILGGRAVLPSEDTLRAIVFDDLGEAETRELVSQIVPDSGRAFRSLIMGTIRIPRRDVDCPVLCVSGGADRNVSSRISRSIATRYDAEHQVHRDRGHWIVAESAVEQVAPPVVEWLKKILATSSVPRLAKASR